MCSSAFGCESWSYCGEEGGDIRNATIPNCSNLFMSSLIQILYLKNTSISLSKLTFFLLQID